MNQPLPEGDPSELGLDPKRLAQINPAMARFVNAKMLPHVTTLIVKSGKIVHLDTCGPTAGTNSTSWSVETLHRLYSNSKLLAGIATLVLCERGQLTLDDPVAKFLPEWQDLLVVNFDEPMFPRRAKRDLTIRDLLANTTGLLTPQMIPEFVRLEHEASLKQVGLIKSNDQARKPLTLRERVRVFAELPLLSHPGDSFVYHVGYPILEVILTKLADGNLEQFLTETIFKPLRMNDTSICISESNLSRLADLFVVTRTDTEPAITVFEDENHRVRYLQPRTDFDLGGAGGGVISTIGDYARFAQMLSNGGELDGTRILGRKTVELITANHSNRLTIPLTGPGYHWGLGVSVYHGQGCLPKLRSIGTYGWGGAAGTHCFIDPNEELIGVLFTQLLNHDQLSNNNFRDVFERLTYQALV